MKIELTELKEVSENVENTNSENLNFIKIDIKVNRELAFEIYTKEYNQNINSMKDFHISYNQWLVEKEIEKLTNYINNL